MTYKASLKISFDSEWTSTHYNSGFDDTVLPEEHYTFQIPAEDLNVHQLFRFFATVARTMGHDEINIMKGGCGLAFSEERSVENMRKVADEFDIILSEDFSNKVIPLENKNYELEKEVRDLKARLARCENPDAEQYLDEEIEAMTAENESNN